MRTLSKITTLLILLLSISAFPQGVYEISFSNDKLTIQPTNQINDSGLFVTTFSPPMFELYAPESKVILGYEQDLSTDDIERYQNMDNGDTKIGELLRYNIDMSGNFELYYYSYILVTNYFTPQKLDNVYKEYVLEIKEKSNTHFFTIKEGKVIKDL